MSKQEVIQYQPQGTCCRAMQIVVEDGKIVDADFMGGCNGNLKGIKSLIKGMEIDDVIERLNAMRRQNNKLPRSTGMLFETV